jgi:hypothetical protein
MVLHQKFLIVLFACLTLLVPTRGNAQICFQSVGGVPGAYGQPPDWWTAGSGPLGTATLRFIDDPRWQGATGYSHISDTANFKVLVESEGTARFLVMAWHVRADPSNANHRLYVGFWDETSSQGNVFRLQKAVTTATPVSGASFDGHNGTPSGGFSGRFYHRVGAGGWVLNNVGGSIIPPLPTWLKNDTRIDLFCTSITCDEWAFRMRIPIDPAADVTADDPTGVKITAGGVYRFWYQVQDGLSLGTLAAYGWPEATSVASETNPPCSAIPPLCFPDPMDVTNPWNRVNDLGGSPCNGDIGLQPGSIYANAIGSIEVNLTSPNIFHARPTNFTLIPQSGNAIKANFRIANWGSAVGVSPDWLTICPNQVGNVGSIGNMDRFDIECSWTVPNPCDFVPPGTNGCGVGSGSRTTDQCMLVDLASAAGSGPFLFSPQSAWQNMMFTGASRIVKPATLDIKALPPISGGGPNRDLYVYVQTRNMPERVMPNQPNPGIRLLSGAARDRLAKLQLPTTGTISSKDAQRIATAANAGQLSFDDVQAIMPTYIAYVWHDTGKRLGTGPSATKVLEPQPSFGMFTWHDGNVNGWRYGFEGQNITQIAPNFYKISVPEGTSVRVTTLVTACQWPLCLDHYLSLESLLIYISIALLLLVGLAVLILMRRASHP